ncbi:MAG TPA: hypothetical protein VFM05_04355 [Candidatus Saccharimonadales bacterium]|nr:hypothetical protein [Candidatus Saccharimonadales bacterium]
MSRLSHLLALAEADLRAQEDDDAWLSQAADAVEAAYYERKANENQAADTSTNSDELMTQAAEEAEAAYYRREAAENHAGEASSSKEIVVEDWESNDDELLFPSDYTSE